MRRAGFLGPETMRPSGGLHVIVHPGQPNQLTGVVTDWDIGWVYVRLFVDGNTQAYRPDDLTCLRTGARLTLGE